MEFHRAARERALKAGTAETKAWTKVDDGDLRQFIAQQLSLHTAHLQTLLEGLEQRILDFKNLDGRETEQRILDFNNLDGQSLLEASGAADPGFRRPKSGSTDSGSITYITASPTANANSEQHAESSPSRQSEQISALRAASIATIPSEVPAPEDTLPGSMSYESHDDPLPVRASQESAFTQSASNVSGHDAMPSRFSIEMSLEGTRSSKDDDKSKSGTRQFDVEDEMRQLNASKKFRRSVMKKRNVAQLKRSMSKGSLQAGLSLRARVKALMSSRPAELVISFLIFANAMVIGAQVDDQMKSPTPNGDNDVFRIIDIVFTVLFTVELVLRLVAETVSHYFYRKNPQLYWNIFDFMLILLSILEELLNVVIGSMPNVSLLRLFRMFRLVRIFRIVRVMRFFRDLRIMASGIAQSMQSLVWALMLLSSLMYFTAVCLMQFAAEEGQNRSKNNGVGDLTDVQYSELLKYFGSLFQSLFTLYTSITGGLDWKDAADPLFDLGWMLGVFFSFYIAFAVLCVMNIITGVFVENCNKMTAKDEDLVYMEELELRRQWYDEVHDIFTAADANACGFLNVREFSDKVEEDARLRAWMRKIGVHIESYSANGLFQLLDLDGDGVLDFNEFALALQQLHGQARSIDVAKIAHSMHVLRRLVLGMAERMTPDLVQNDRILAQARISQARMDNSLPSLPS